ncbi:MAG TPA: tetratricopeptide repeat protein [Thermoanaerobaculia bacterium]|jgi:tetratricopeptide (TPR) repeat protein|nr:tetratricopeptide repeat protein [Thermoanaerobaculia bacterium]
MGLVEDLREELARGEVLVVVGTGVSIQATGGAECAKWDGLIRDGIEHAVGTGQLTEAVAKTLRGRLKKNSVKDLLAVAQKVSEALGAPDGGEFRRWLRESVGNLELKDGSIIDAVHALGAPIATTNYDDLLTRGRGTEHVPWTDVPAAQEIHRGDRDNVVLHLHGCFDHPESVVLGVKSYSTILKSRGAQAIQQALAAHKSLLFIGCGEGLSDPNFGALLKWIGAAFGKTIYRNYRLCLTKEQKPPEGRLFYVPYGDDFKDLAPFLRDLAPRKASFALPNPGYCFGREREVEEVVTALLADRPQPLPILGGPGMGKTTIALTALHDARVAERFRERRWFVRCDGVNTRTELAAAIARTLGLAVTPNVEPDVLAVLTARPAALVLDNGETPLDADGAQVEELLSVLATINSLALAITIRGHRRPPGVPWRATTEPDALPEGPAIEAFVAASGKPHFADDPHLPRLLAVLDGVPLAITLMAHFAEMFNALEPVWSRWEKKRTAMLREGDTRLTNLRVSYELSIGVLSAAARRLLSVLATLPDGVAHRDLEGIFAGPDDSADELRRRALVFEEGQRMRMRAPLREYVVAECAPDPDDGQRVVAYYLALAARQGQKVGAAGGVDAVARLAPEVANVEAMLERSRSVSAYDLVITLGGWERLMRFTGLGSTRPIERIVSSGVDANRSHPVLQASVFLTLGNIALDRWNHDEARARYQQALMLFRQVEEVVSEAYCIRGLGDIALLRSDYDEARRLFEQALRLLQEEADVHATANCIQRLGDVALKCSDNETARVRYEESLPLYRQVSDMQGEANVIWSLGDLARVRSDHKTARACYEEALPLYRQVGDLLGEANCSLCIGMLAKALGTRDEAEFHYRAALRLYERIGNRYSIGLAHLRLAEVVADAGARTAHVGAAREAWQSIKRDDLIAKYLHNEFEVG